MAGDANLGTAVLKTTLDPTGVQQGMATLGQSARGMSDKMRADMSIVSRSLMMGLTLPLVAAAGAIVKVAGDFERSMNRVNALTGASAQEFGKLRDQAKDLGATTQFSASQAADAMGFLAMAGFEAQQIYAAMPATLDLAASAQLDLAQSADIVSNVLTGFRLPVDQLGRAVDVLTKTFTSANTDLSQLGEAFKYVGPVAKSAGLSFEETAAGLGLLSNAGIQASSAGTGLRQILITLSKEQEVFGVATKDAAGNMRPLVDIMAEAEGKTIGLEDAIETFNIRGGPAFLAILGQGSDALRELSDELANSAGTAERIKEIQMQGLVGQITQLKSAAEGLAIAFGDAGLLKSFTGLVARATGLVRRFTELDDSKKRLIITVGGLLALLGPSLALFVQLSTVIPAVVRSIAALRGALIALRIAGLPLLGPAGLVVAGAAALVTLGAVLATRRDSVKVQAEAAAEALAGGSRDSLAGALGEMADKAKGPARDALIQLKEELEMEPDFTAVLAGFDEIIEKADVDTAAALTRIKEELELEGDVTSVLAAFDEVIASVDESLRPALERVRSDLIQTGDVGVEQAIRIAGAMVQASAKDLGLQPDQFNFAPIQDAFTAAGVGQDGFGRFMDSVTGDALTPPNFVAAIGELTAVSSRLADSTGAYGRDLKTAVDDLIAYLIDLQTRAITRGTGGVRDPGYSTPAPSLVDDPGAGAPAPTGGTAERTWKTVLEELDRMGTAAINRAKFDGTNEAFLRAAEDRVRLIDYAITELITDFLGAVPQGELEGLRTRLEAAAADVARYSLEVERTVPEPSDVAAITDEIIRSGLGFLDELGNFDVRAARAVQNARLESIRDEALEALAASVEEATALRAFDVAGITDPLDRLPRIPGILDERGDFDVQVYRQAVQELEESVDRRLDAEAERIARAALDVASIQDDRSPQVLDALGNVDVEASRRLANERMSLITDVALEAAHDAVVGAVQQADLLRTFDVAGILDPLDRPPVVLDEYGDLDLRATREARDELLRSVDEQLAAQLERIKAAALDIVGIVDPLDRPPRVLDAAGDVDLPATREAEAARAAEVAEQIRVLEAVSAVEARVAQIRESAAGVLGTAITQEQAFINELEKLAGQMREVGALVLAEEIGLLADNIRDATDAAAAAREENELRTGDSAERFQQGARDFLAVIGQGYKDSTKEQVQSALSFAATIKDTAVAFADTLGALLRGDLDAGNAISTIGGFVGSVVSFFDPVVGPLIALGSQLVGGVINAFSPGDQQKEAERARGATPRGAPAIEFNLTVLQSLSVQSLTDPASRQAVNGLLNETVERITRVIEQNVIPRVSRLEAAVL